MNNMSNIKNEKFTKVYIEGNTVIFKKTKGLEHLNPLLATDHKIVALNVCGDLQKLQNETITTVEEIKTSYDKSKTYKQYIYIISTKHDIIALRWIYEIVPKTVTFTFKLTIWETLLSIVVGFVAITCMTVPLNSMWNWLLKTLN